MDSLDREIAAALAVDPSPEFVARVRTRIAREPAPASWRGPRMLVSAVVATAVIVTAVVLAPRPKPESPAAVQIVRSAAPAALAVESVQPVGRPVRHRRAQRLPVPITLVSINEMPTAPMGTVVPETAFEVVTMTGVHP